METYICYRCKVEKNVSEFGKQSNNSIVGIRTVCKECCKVDTEKFRRTKPGLASLIYSIQKVHSKSRGHVPPSYTRQELIKWLMEQPGFHKAFEYWSRNGYKKDFVPSVDRFDDKKSYTMDNIRIVHWKINNDKNRQQIKKWKSTKTTKPVMQLDLQGNEVARFHSVSSAARSVGAERSQIRGCCNGKASYITARGYKWEFLTK